MAPRKTRAQAEETEQSDGKVTADSLEIGDEVWIPNSRNAQPITAILSDPGDENTPATIRLSVGDASWVVAPTHEIRKK